MASALDVHVIEKPRVRRLPLYHTGKMVNLVYALNGRVHLLRVGNIPGNRFDLLGAPRRARAPAHQSQASVGLRLA